MRKRVAGVVLLLCVLLSYISPACSAITVLVGEHNTVHLPLVAVGYGDMQATPEGRLYDLFYPSGMRLPTMFMDPACLFSDMEEVEVSGVTYLFLTNNWPTPENKYTYAEIVAAQMWLGVWKAVVYDEDVSTVDAASAYDWACAQGIDFYTGTYRTTMTDEQMLRDLLLELEERDLGNTVYHEDIIISRGSGYVWDSVLGGYDYVDQCVTAMFWDTRTDYMSLAGLAISADNSATYSYSSLLMETGYSTETGDGGAYEGGQVVPPVEDAPAEEPSISRDPSREEEEPEIPPVVAGSGSAYVNGFETGFTAENSYEKGKGVRDYLTIACLIVIVVFCAIAIVVDFIRRKNDPINKYRRW